MKTKQSPMIQLLTVIWENGKKDSWGRINYSMRRALEISVGSGTPCQPEDFDFMRNHFNWSYWVGESTEWIYTSAIININESVIEAYEKWMKRKPFRANEVRSGYHGECWLPSNTMNRNRERLAEGLSFPFERTRAWVTSFNDKDGVIRAAVYKSIHQEGNPVKLLKLSHENICEMFPSNKKSATNVESVNP